MATGKKGPISRFGTALQSAVLAYRQRAHGPEVLLVTSRDSGRWVLPKGMVESGMSAPESAAKEAFEEAGAVGFVSRRRVGSYRYAKPPGEVPRTCVVEVYPMRVTALRPDWPERSRRRRAWVTLERAVECVRERDLKALIGRFGDRLAGRRIGETDAGRR